MGLNINMGNLVQGAVGALLGGQAGSVLGGLFNNRGKFNIGGLGAVLAAITGNKAKLTGYVYKYNVKSYQVMLPGEDPINLLPDAIDGITIIRDYENCIHPIMEINSRFPPKIHQKIVKNKSEVKIRLRLVKSKYDRSGTFIANSDYINDVFDVIMDDETDFKDEEQYNEEQKADGGSGNENGDKGRFNRTDYTTPFTFSLWRQKDLDTMRKVVNDIILNTTISDAIAKIYSDAGVNKMLISPLDNTKSYSEIRIAPQNLMNLSQYIDKIYGVYYTGSWVFYDYRCLYYLSKNGVCDAKEDGEFTRNIFIIPKSTKTDNSKVGTTEDADNKLYYHYIQGDQIDFMSPSSTNDAIEGNNLTIVDSKRNETTEIEGAGSQRGEGNKKVRVDNNSNEYSKSTIMSGIVEQTLQAVVQLVDYDEDSFTPNKEFVINFKDRKLQNRNGFYRISESIAIFNKVGSELRVSGKHTLVFKAPIEGENEKEPETNVSDNNTKPSTNIYQESSSSNNVKDKSGKVDAVSSKDGETPTVNSPQGKLLPSNETTVNNTQVETSINRNSNYKYDSLGNVLGLNIPDYSKITLNDSIPIMNAKKVMQGSCFPCPGPKGKFST